MNSKAVNLKNEIILKTIQSLGALFLTSQSIIKHVQISRERKWREKSDSLNSQMIFKSKILFWKYLVLNISIKIQVWFRKKHASFSEN